MDEPQGKWWTRESAPAILFCGGLASTLLGYLLSLGLSFVDHPSLIGLGLSYVTLYGGILSTVAALILNLATRSR